MRYNGSSPEKRRLRALYAPERRNFERLNKKAKRKYQLVNNSVCLTYKLGLIHVTSGGKLEKLGIQNERKMGIPMEVKASNGCVLTHTDDVMNRWKTDFENLFSDSTNPCFDDNHLENIKQSLHDNIVHGLHTDISILNEPISRTEVDHSLY